MTLPAAKWRVIYNIRLEDDDVLVSTGPFEILYSRRCSGETLKKRHPDDDQTTYGYGMALDVLIAGGTTLTIIRDEKEWRRYE